MPAQKVIGRGTWIDKLARELVEREQLLGRSLSMVRVESGLGASGVPHLGSLGDAVRAYGVKLALEDQGYGSELVAYSDDLDGLRKVPPGFPKDLGEHLAKPVSLIDDPFGEYDSYGARMSHLLLEGLDALGVQYRFQSARDAYASGLFQEQIHTILMNSERIGAKISEMVSQEKFRYRLPYFPVCGQCRRLYTAEAFEYVPDERKVRYRCRDAKIGSATAPGCGHDGESDIAKDLGKLAWKVEFAARWQALDVRFEAYGKDIMDSVRVNDWVSDSILGYPHPHHIRYEMLLDKGGRKISKSSGNVVTLQRWLRYGTAQSALLLLYKRIGGARELGLEDVPNLMDEYGELEDIYFGRTKVENGARLARSRGLYQYVNLLRPPENPGPRVSYRLLVELCRIFREERQERVAKKLAEYGLREYGAEIRRLVDLAGNYADDFGQEWPEVVLDGSTAKALVDLAHVLTAREDPENLQDTIFAIARSNAVPARDLFRSLYRILLNTDRGPRLGPFIMDIGRHKAGEAIRRHTG